MTQAQLDRRVSAATGESLTEIRQRGFSLADPLDVHHDPEPTRRPQIVDWDGMAASRVSLFPGRGRTAPRR
jgi:hypothetical protein